MESKEDEMLTYQLNFEIKPYKTDEFLISLGSYLRSIRKEKGCLGFGAYSEKQRTKLRFQTVTN